MFRLARTVGKTGSEALLEGRCGLTRLRLPQRLVCAACGIEAAPWHAGRFPSGLNARHDLPNRAASENQRDRPLFKGT